MLTYLVLTWSVNAQSVLPLDVRIVQPITFPARSAFLASISKMENATIVPFHVCLVLQKIIARNAVLAIISKMENALHVLTNARHVILKLNAYNATWGIILIMENV